MKKLNNKGFTLVEVLAVLVILVVIMSIAIPNISSSLERSKSKQDDARKKILISAAELYVADNKNTVYNNLDGDGEYRISLDKLVENGYVTEDQVKDSSGDDFKEDIIFIKPSTFCFEDDAKCLGTGDSEG